MRKTLTKKKQKEATEAPPQIISVMMATLVNESKATKPRQYFIVDQNLENCSVEKKKKKWRKNSNSSFCK